MNTLEHRYGEHYWPFRKADAQLESSLFWLPVTGFPAKRLEKAWLIEFIRQFACAVKESLKLRQENFINFDYIHPDLMTPFLQHSVEFNPVLGMLVQPSKAIFRPPTDQQLKEMIDSGDVSRLHNATKSMVYWLPKNKGAGQLEVFGGFGALISVWLAPCPKTTPPDFRIPPKVLENPYFKPLNIPGEIEFTFSLADSFLPRSLELFAKNFKTDPQYAGMPFAVPLLGARDILATANAVRQQWLSLMGAYLAESRDDGGVVLWCRPEIDPLVKQIVEDMHDQGLYYPAD